MASITKKIIRGKAYFYARECQRVDGKPKIVWQKYLGRAEDIIAVMSSATEKAPGRPPQEATLAEFGAVAALYDLAGRLRLAEHIDRHVPKKGDGPSVGTYLLTAALNRCVAPCSKAAIGKWFQGTVLRRLLPVQASQLTSQRFWENMDRVLPEALAAIERDVTLQAVREFGIDLSRLLFDATNFFTFIDTFNERSTLAQRGHSKEGRASLRIVGVALLIAADSQVPLLHQAYPGGRPDAPTFSGLTDQLAARCREIAGQAEHITLVFDKGNNSQENLDAVAQGPYHFIGSLVPTQHPGLLAVPDEKFRSLQPDGLAAVRTYRTLQEVFGVERTVVVAFNQNLFRAQVRTLLREIAKRCQRLRQLGERLHLRRAGVLRRGRRPTVESVRKKVRGWLRARHMSELFQVEVHEHEGLPWLTWRFDDRAWKHLQDTLLGKTILFTDNEDWSDAEIVRGYRSQYLIEDSFRCLKNPRHICLRPQFHWTDQKIRVHVFCCILALLLCSLLRRELHQSGIQRSIPALLKELSGIREVAVIYPPEGRKKKPVIHTTLSQMTPSQRRLYEALGLSRYHSA